MGFSMRMALAAWVVLAGSAWTDRATAQDCSAPPRFTDTPHPAIAPLEDLVSHTEEITIDSPLTVVLRAVDKPLSETIKSSTSLPGITGSHMLLELKGSPYCLWSRRIHLLSGRRQPHARTLDVLVPAQQAPIPGHARKSRQLPVPNLIPGQIVRGHDAQRIGLNQNRFGTAHGRRVERFVRAAHFDNGDQVWRIFITPDEMTYGLTRASKQYGCQSSEVYECR